MVAEKPTYVGNVVYKINHFNILNILIGKILSDEKLIKEYNIDEQNGFVVIMITKVYTM